MWLSAAGGRRSCMATSSLRAIDGYLYSKNKVSGLFSPFGLHMICGAQACDGNVCGCLLFLQIIQPGIAGVCGRAFFGHALESMGLQAFYMQRKVRHKQHRDMHIKTKSRTYKIFISLSRPQSKLCACNLNAAPLIHELIAALLAAPALLLDPAAPALLLDPAAPALLLDPAAIALWLDPAAPAL
ncbi:uncharacterized protein NEMAJ01_0883 [Nematocida major]|uniref:uncharacterized protein n=1 Tax=Nematocida major TaxID=1912982 RepID=UPI0020083FEE|nr:uncharacterized protein NEMAJ01_0883 [Nematocida major]KAH9385987.1 hypothetical protein NEMAJ01_0883 [Nematocida major]